MASHPARRRLMAPTAPMRPSHDRRRAEAEDRKGWWGVTTYTQRGKHQFVVGYTQLSQDERPIKSVYMPDGRAWGTNEHTEIVAYDETGEMAHVPWIAIIEDGHVTVRFHAAQASSVYYT